MSNIITGKPFIVTGNQQGVRYTISNTQGALNMTSNIDKAIDDVRFAASGHSNPVSITTAMANFLNKQGKLSGVITTR